MAVKFVWYGFAVFAFGLPIGWIPDPEPDDLRSTGWASACRSASVKLSEVVEMGDEMGVSRPVDLRGAGDRL